MKRRIAAAVLAVIMTLSMTACGSGQTAATENTGEAAEEEIAADISLWTFPVGSWGDAAAVEQIISGFNREYPKIRVSVEYLDYAEGDNKIQTARAEGKGPDIILEGPERLVSWGFSGWMADLNDLWDDKTVKDVADNNLAVLAACISPDGNYYEYPLCMNAHCMAVNKDLFEAAGAMQYIDEETRTWTTADFEKAMRALKDYGAETTGIVYCGGQGGDQGTRALAMNLYSAQFTNGAHTKWMMDSEEGIKGIEQLTRWCEAGLLSYDAEMVAADELSRFASGEAAMTFCWNASNMANYIEQMDFTPYAVSFPSEDGVPELAGGIYGFGVFDNQDDKRIEASKAFIKYVCDDSAQGAESVRASGFFPVKASMGDVYSGTDKAETMQEFAIFMQYLGDYYNVTPAWAEQRTAWWTMLQHVFAGNEVEKSVKNYTSACNEATTAVLKESGK